MNGHIPEVHEEAVPQPTVLVVFGARGDLARRMLLPGLERLTRAGLMPDRCRVIGSGRNAPDGDWADEVREALEGAAPAFLKTLSFAVASEDDGETLAQAVRQAREELGDDSRVVLYLSVPPNAAKGMVEMLGRCGLNKGARLVMEKPFGWDLDSAKDLNATIHELFDEQHVFRIDHFLGEEAALDILALRFANELLEPIWNRDHVAAVFIDVPEKIGLERRGGFYEQTGALRDMVVTHLAQLLGLIAMERPSALEPEQIRDAKLAIFAALQPFEQVVYGQFEGYLVEDGVKQESRTETFVALRAYVENDRWRGVPFLLRTGKAMAEERKLISIVLRDDREELFGDPERRPDEITIELTDDPKITISLRVKRPGPGLELVPASLSLDVERATEEHGLAAYERLLLDVMRGDQLLFTRADEVERLWEVAAKVLARPPESVSYERGSWGPAEALDLAAPLHWRLPQDA